MATREESTDLIARRHNHLLPIWERWADGNPAMRRLLECESADPRSHDERRRILVEAITGLMVRAPDGRAAIHAGLAVLAIVTGETGDAVDELVRIASRADAEAQARQPHG